MTNSNEKRTSSKGIILLVTILVLAIIISIASYQKKSESNIAAMPNQAALSNVAPANMKIPSVQHNNLSDTKARRADQINCFQQVTQLYPAYKMKVSSGQLAADFTFQSYFNTQYLAEVYCDLEISARELSATDIEALAREKESKKLVLYDTLKVPGLDWYDGCGRDEPKL